MKKALLFIVILGLIWIRTAYCQQEQEEESLSPYFFVQSDDASLDPFPLLETKAKVNIAGVVADIELTQVYKNDGKRTIEAIYVFPLGTRSAIHAMRMKIGERMIEAEINEKSQARKIYDDAKNQGQTTSLLEQQRPNVFQMNVANIMSGDIVEVTVNYTELLVPDKGVYEFVYPAVVGPRYGGEVADTGNNNWIETPYHTEGEDSGYNFDIDLKIAAGMPIREVWVPTHKTMIAKTTDGADIRLSPQESKGGDRDFILRYTLQGDQIQTGLLFYPGTQENFFLLMCEPPAKVNLRDVGPREYVFCS